jgi:hypothetical protein
MLFLGAAYNYSPRRSEAKLFRIEFSLFSKEDSIKRWCDQLECQLFEAEYLADEHSVFVPADVVAMVHQSRKKTLRRTLQQPFFLFFGYAVIAELSTI